MLSLKYAIIHNYGSPSQNLKNSRIWLKPCWNTHTSYILFPPEENWHRLDGGSASLAGGLSGTHSPLYWQNVSTQISIFLPDFSDWENTSHWVEAKRMIQISRWGGELCKVFQNLHRLFNSMPIGVPDVPWKPKCQKSTLCWVNC